MKTRHLKLIGLSLAVALVAVLWFKTGNQKSQLKNPVPLPSPVPQTTANPVPNAGASGVATPKKVIDQVVSKAELMKEAWAGENGKPMDTYGKVVDQYGSPIAGVKVEESVGLYVDFTHSGGNTYYTETDQEGKFKFTGIQGAWSGYDFKKTGYEYNLKLPTSTRCKNYTPDPEHPIIFTMWKLKGAEPMKAARINEIIPCDGSATGFNVLTGKPVPTDGDLVVKLTRSPVNIVHGKPYNWSITFEVPGGGLVETSAPYLLEAPAEGYQPSITYNMPADMAQWSSSLSHSYYFRSRSGQVYGNMKVNISIGGGPQPAPTLFDALIYANPSGSRNLEYDPAKKIRP